MAEKDGTDRMINLDPFFKILYFSILIFLLIILSCIAIFWDMNKFFSIQVFFIISLFFSFLVVTGLIIEYLDKKEKGSDEQYKN